MGLDWGNEMSLIILTRGTIVAPNGPDLTPNTPGYDNAGLFGPAFTNLGDVPYTLAWTLAPPIAVQYGNVLDVALTIHGFTYNMGAVPPGDQIGIRSQYGIDAFGNLSYASFHSFLSTLPVGAPNFAGSAPLASYDIDILSRPLTNIGQATLEISGHPYMTVVNFSVPAPELGCGMVGLLTIVLLMTGLGLHRSVYSSSPLISPTLP